MIRAITAAALLVCTAATAFAQSEKVIEIPSRGANIRALMIEPPNAVGSVILLAGGHGRLDISPAGAMHWGAGNQLVRTRASYAAAGFVTVVPDISPNLKKAAGVVDGYRFSEPHAHDIGAIVRYLRNVKSPVVVVGTSRGAISAGNAVAKLSGPSRPDAVVFTAPMLVTVPGSPSVQKAANGDPKRLRVPMLIVGHRKDKCRWTLPDSIDTFRAWHAKGGGTSDVVLLDGPAGTGDPCEARAAHGFAGLDGEVVATVTGWIRKQNLSAR
jgi:hypothetical protein